MGCGEIVQELEQMEEEEWEDEVDLEERAIRSHSLPDEHEHGEGEEKAEDRDRFHNLLQDLSGIVWLLNNSHKN